MLYSLSFLLFVLCFLAVSSLRPVAASTAAPLPVLPKVQLPTASSSSSDRTQNASLTAPFREPASIPRYPSTRPIPRYTLKQFLEPANAHLLTGQHPFIITDFMNGWNHTQWTIDFIRHIYGDSFVQFHSSFIPFQSQAQGNNQPMKDDVKFGSLSEALDTVLQHPEKSYIMWNPLWSEWNLMKSHMTSLHTDPRLIEFFFGDDEWIHAGLKDEHRRSEFIMSTAFKLNLVGGRNAGSQLHVDFLHAGVWQFMVTGSKSWFICDYQMPNVTDFLYHGYVDAFNPNWVKFPRFTEAECYLDTVEAGELIYDPPSWWHTTRNHGHGLNIAFSGSTVTAYQHEYFTNQLNYQCESPGRGHWEWSEELCYLLQTRVINYLETKYGNGPRIHPKYYMKKYPGTDAVLDGKLDQPKEPLPLYYPELKLH